MSNAAGAWESRPWPARWWHFSCKGGVAMYSAVPMIALFHKAVLLKSRVKIVQSLLDKGAYVSESRCQSRINRGSALQIRDNLQ